MTHRTPKLTNHARQRCSEMGVATKRAKRIARDPDITRPSGAGILAKADHDPEIAVVYADDPDGSRVILTVLPNTQEKFLRPEHMKDRTRR